VVAGPFSHRSNFGGTSYATPVCAGIGPLVSECYGFGRIDAVAAVRQAQAMARSSTLNGS
jgi:hypothetical protein